VRRRSFLLRLGSLAAAPAFIGGCASRPPKTAQRPAPAAESPHQPQAGSLAARALQVQELTERAFVVCGGGGNVTVFHSEEGVLLVDGGARERSAEVLELVQQRTGAARIHTLFNTHWHWDQTGSNLTLGPSGTRIIAHENTRLWLGTDVDCKWQHRVYRRLPRAARPTQTFYTRGSLSFGGETVDYGYLPQAHTDGDIYVRFKKANVLVAGCVVAVGSYPILDYCTNGWIGGTADATQALIDLIDPATRVIPAEGAPQSLTDLEAQHAMLVTVKQRLATLLADGMSAEDMLAAAPTREFDARWGDPTLFITNAYPGLAWRAAELGVHIV
jgi:cyclase